MTKAHDIGLRMVQNTAGDPGFEVIVGGGLGRTPMVGKVIKDFLPKADLLPYLEAIVSVYNLLGRRDNKYKARIKITVHEHGIEEIKARVDERFLQLRETFTGVDQALLDDIHARFKTPDLASGRSTESFEAAYAADPLFRSWADTNLSAHKGEWLCHRIRLDQSPRQDTG